MIFNPKLAWLSENVYKRGGGGEVMAAPTPRCFIYVEGLVSLSICMSPVFGRMFRN